MRAHILTCTFTNMHTFILNLGARDIPICATFDSSRGERFREVLRMERRLNEMEIKDILIF